MRDSFVFHFEYLEDIPEDLQAQYAMYVINYARYGEEPALDDWRDKRMWNKTKNRMDEETEKYERKCRNLRNYQTENVISVTFDRRPQDRPEIEEPLPEYNNGEEKPKKKRFEKPTADQVREYCQERGNNIDAQTFVDFYEAKGWKVGREPMKDWKAAVRTWEKRQRPAPAYGAQPRDLPADRLTL